MEEQSYEFDPCSIDENDTGEESIDNWKPASRNKNIIVQSEWRKNQIGNDYNQHPDRYDLKKIKNYILNDRPDSEIMRVYGITAETLTAIKHGRYDHINGITIDTQMKVFNEFKKLENKITRLSIKIDVMIETMFTTKESMKSFKKECDARKPKISKKKMKIEKSEKKQNKEYDMDDLDEDEFDDM